MRTAILYASLVAAPDSAADNDLTPREKAAGWML